MKSFDKKLNRLIFDISYKFDHKTEYELYKDYPGYCYTKDYPRSQWWLTTSGKEIYLKIKEKFL